MATGLGSLTGTLEGDQLLTQIMALQQQQQEELAARTQQATQSAGQAAQQYQQLAAAPPPDLAPFQALIPALAGNFASVIARDPSYRQEAQEGLQESRAGLLRARAQNLAALKDVAGQKAEEAQRAGDLETTEKYRRQYETLAKQYELISANQKRTQAVEDKENELKIRHQNRLDEIAATGAQARLTDRSKPPGGTAVMGGEDPAVASFAGQVQRGEIEFAGVPAKYKPAVSTYMTNNAMQVVPKKVRDTLAELSTGRAALNRIKGFSVKLNTADWKGRLLQGGRLTAAGISQKNPEVSAFNAVRRGLLAALSRATGERGVLTNQDVERAKQLLPTVFDSEEVASRKLLESDAFFDEKEQMLRGAYFSTAGAAPPATTPPPPTVKTTGKLVRMVDRQGRVRTIDAAEVPDAINKGGWKRAPAK